jgi:hypothetical protein
MEIAMRFDRFVGDQNLPVWLNPDEVRVVKPHQPGFTTIEFDSDHSVTVKGDPADVVRQLEGH